MKYRWRLRASALGVLALGLACAAASAPPTRERYGGQAGERLLAGVLEHTLTRLAANYRAGARVAVVQLGWDRAQPAPDHFDSAYWIEIAGVIANVRQHGYRVALDLGMQYPPAWIFTLPHSRYVNQFGQAFAAGLGEDVPNAVFNQAVRDRQAAYIAAVATALGEDFLFVRLGAMKYGELAYPTHRFGATENAYWGFDAVAQGLTAGLPAGVSACPVPGWLPGQSSADHATARAFLEWMLDALVDYQNWQVQTARAHFPGALAMLYPSWGCRPGQIESAIQGDLAGGTSPEINGEVQRGLDFERLVGALTDTNVIVYCTWVDSSPAYSHDEGDDPRQWSPARYLAHLAATSMPPLAAWAENTGGGDLATLQLAFRRVRAYGYQGFLYAFERDLYDGQAPEIADFAYELGLPAARGAIILQVR